MLYNEYMSALLMIVAGNRTFNRTIFQPRLYVYDDRLIYKKRHLFTSEEKTIVYNQITQIHIINLHLFFSHINIVTTGSDTMQLISYVPKKFAKRAKKVIDQKVYDMNHNKESKNRPDTQEDKKFTGAITSYEKSIVRLDELLRRGRLTKKDFKKKRKQLLKKLK